MRMADLGPEVTSLPGVKILGSPLGSPGLVEHVSRERMKKERELWRANPKVADLLCAWPPCAGPR